MPTQRWYFFSFLFIYISLYTFCINCNIVAGYCVPINSYLCQYWQHWQNVVIWAANEDDRTGIDTEKIATNALPLPHKNMHKIRLNTVFILFRASQMCGLYPLLWFCFIIYFTNFILFFVWSCWLCNGPQCCGEKQVICYHSIQWCLLTVILKSHSYNAIRQGHCIPTGTLTCQHLGKDNNSFL